MKKLFLYILLFITLGAKAQMETQDAGVTGALIKTNATLQEQGVEQKAQSKIMNVLSEAMVSMEETEAKYKKAMETADWAKNLKTAKKLYNLIESVYCTYQNLQVMGMRSGQFGNCAFSFRYQMATVKLQSAIDFMSIVLSNGKSMSAGERMKTLNDVMNSFNEANMAFASLTAQLQTLQNIQNHRTQNRTQVRQILTLRYK